MAHTLIHFSSVLQFKKLRSMWRPSHSGWDTGMFQGLQKKFFFVCCALAKFFSNCFALRMTFAHSVWASALLDGDESGEDTRMEEFLWIYGAGFDLFCLPGLKLTFGTGLTRFRNTLLFPANHFVSHGHSFVSHNQPQSWREIQPLRLASIPSAFLLSVLWSPGQRWCSLLVTQRMHSALMKWARCFWSASFSKRGSSEQFSVLGSVCGWKTSQTQIQTVPAVQNVPLICTQWGTILSD